MWKMLYFWRNGHNFWFLEFSSVMKKIFPIIFIASLLVHVSSCEKDDICVEGDTPPLVIGFFDAADTSAFKSVPSLRIRAIDNDSILKTDTFSDRSNSSDSLFVPLRIDGTSTTYEFIIDSADDETTGDETGTIDVLNFTYETREVFISRACGFVANYNGLAVEQPTNGTNWIQDITIVQQTVENSNTIHVKIFH